MATLVTTCKFISPVTLRFTELQFEYFPCSLCSFYVVCFTWYVLRRMLCVVSFASYVLRRKFCVVYFASYVSRRMFCVVCFASYVLRRIFLYITTVSITQIIIHDHSSFICGDTCITEGYIWHIIPF